MRAARADDPSKIPPAPPRKTVLESVVTMFSNNRKVSAAVGLLFLVGILAPFFISPKKKRKKPYGGHEADDISFEDDDTSSPSFGSRTFGNVPLSQQEAQRTKATATASGSAAPRTYGNVPLSQQKKHAD